MKNLLLVLMFVFPVMAYANATESNQNTGKFQEGTHFQILEGFEPFDKPTVTEMFSIYCPACYQWEKGPLKPLKSYLAQQNIEFKQAHMTFMGEYSKQATTALAMTQGTPLYAAVKQAFFNRIHVERKGDWGSDSEFFQTMKKAGLNQKDFEAQQSNLVVMKKVLDWNRYGKVVQSVPSFLVNNRYLINTGSIKSQDELNQLIDYLLQQPT